MNPKNKRLFCSSVFIFPQADIKLQGLPLSIAMEAVDRAYSAKVKILDIMDATQDKPRSTRKESGPVLESMEIPPEKRSRLVGVGGFNLKRLTADTG